jgi:hypothetical protein
MKHFVYSVLFPQVLITQPFQFIYWSVSQKLKANYRKTLNELIPNMWTELEEETIHQEHREILKTKYQK